MTDAAVYYLAGPMSGIPQFNVPLFEQAARELREVHGLTIISPVELDDEATRAEISASPDGKYHPNGRSWATFLARDVELIADRATGIVFLPDWWDSKGARLEAFIGLLCGHDFAQYHAGNGLLRLEPAHILNRIEFSTRRDIYDVAYKRPGA